MALTEEEFEEMLPDYLKESTNDIHARMIKNAPEGISTVEGDLFWDNTRPVAEEISRFKKLSLKAILKLGTTQTTSGKWLDLKGEVDGIPRKDGSAAIQKIEIKATEGTRISAGRVVCTVGSEEDKPIEFMVQDTVVVDSTGIATVESECMQIGTIGNVAPGNIKMFTQPIDGVMSVSNIEIVKDGVEVESDESYLNRILENASNPPTSANDAHYEKWCKEYPGIEDCKIISCWDGNGTVKAIVVADGHKAAKDELVQELHDYIDPYPRQGKAQAPIGAEFTAVSCKEKAINIKVNLQLADGYVLNNCKEELIDSLDKYLKKLPFKTTKYISIARIGNLVLNVPGVIDYSELYLNNSTANCNLLEDEIAVSGTIELGVIS